MKKRVLSLLLAVCLLASLAAPAMAASEEAESAAMWLNWLGLFQGVGTNDDGTTNFDLDRTPMRSEAVTMLVRLLDKEDEAKAGNWETPFTDVPDWAQPYVGYAYVNGLTSGTGTDTFGSDSPVTVTQYLSFVLSALGYEKGVDFQWDKAWELSDELGITDGRYNADTAEFTRGDVAIISYSAWRVKGAMEKATSAAAALDSINSDWSPVKQFLARLAIEEGYQIGEDMFFYTFYRETTDAYTVYYEVEYSTLFSVPELSLLRHLTFYVGDAAVASTRTEIILDSIGENLHGVTHDYTEWETAVSGGSAYFAGGELSLDAKFGSDDICIDFGDFYRVYDSEAAFAQEDAEYACYRSVLSILNQAKESLLEPNGYSLADLGFTALAP